MKIYRVQWRSGLLGDSGTEMRWLSSQSEVRRFIQDALRDDAVEEYEGHDETYVLPKNLDDIVYYVEETEEARDHFFAMNWVVEEVTIPTNKRDMLIFLNHIAYSW
jgi:hypothetical protein